MKKQNKADMLMEKVHGYKNPQVQLLSEECEADERTFLVNRNMMFTGDAFMPAYCSYYT